MYAGYSWFEVEGKRTLTTITHDGTRKLFGFWELGLLLPLPF